MGHVLQSLYMSIMSAMLSGFSASRNYIPDHTRIHTLDYVSLLCFKQNLSTTSSRQITPLLKGYEAVWRMDCPVELWDKFWGDVFAGILQQPILQWTGDVDFGYPPWNCSAQCQDSWLCVPAADIVTASAEGRKSWIWSGLLRRSFFLWICPKPKEV